MNTFSILFQDTFFISKVWRKRLIPIAIGAIGVFALFLLVLLSIASSNTEFFDKYFIWLYAANVVIGASLTLVILIPSALALVENTLNAIKHKKMNCLNLWLMARFS